MYCYHLITNPGLEEIVAEELRRAVSASAGVVAPGGRTGVLAVRSPHPIEQEHLARLRTIYYAIDIRREETIRGLSGLGADRALEQIAQLACETRFLMLDSNRSIAVRCRRRGEHRFRSPQVEREVGTVLVDRYRCPVNLEAPDVTIRVEIIGSNVDLGILITPPEMDRRFTWLYRPRITLSTVVAYALLETARITADGGALLDPFCGSGTIPIETAANFPNAVFASDISAEAVAGTRANCAANGLGDRVVIRRLDAVDPTRFNAAWGSRGITTVVCNPPYGVRLGRKIKFGAFYRGVLSGVARILPVGGRLVLMSSRRRGALNAVVATMPEWHISHVRIIETGGVYPGIFMLERR